MGENEAKVILIRASDVEMKPLSAGERLKREAAKRAAVKSKGARAFKISKKRKG